MVAGPVVRKRAGVRSELSAGARHRRRWASLSTGPQPALRIAALDEERYHRSGYTGMSLALSTFTTHAVRSVVTLPEATNPTQVTLDNPMWRG